MDKAIINVLPSEVVEKLFKAIGLDYIDTKWDNVNDRIKALNDYKFENEILLKKTILDNDKLTFEQKLSLNSLITKNLKKFQRQCKVLKIALDNIDEKAKAENYDSDWLLDFYEKASLIENTDMQNVCGKLLASAASDKNICSKILLNSIFLMGTEQLRDFKNVCRYCFSEIGTKGSTEKISAYPIIYFTKKKSEYEYNGVMRMRMNQLQNLVLIEIDYRNEFVFSKKDIRLAFGNRAVDLSSDEKIKIGNVNFTYEGFLLYTMIEKDGYDNSILEFNIEIWKRRNYVICINGHMKRKNVL